MTHDVQNSVPKSLTDCFKLCMRIIVVDNVHIGTKLLQRSVLLSCIRMRSHELSQYNIDGTVNILAGGILGSRKTLNRFKMLCECVWRLLQSIWVNPSF